MNKDNYPTMNSSQKHRNFWDPNMGSALLKHPEHINCRCISVPVSAKEIEFIQLYISGLPSLMIDTHYGNISYIEYLGKEKERLESQGRHTCVTRTGRRVCLIVDKIA